MTLLKPSDLFSYLPLSAVCCAFSIFVIKSRRVILCTWQKSAALIEAKQMKSECVAALCTLPAPACDGLVIALMDWKEA